MACTIRTPLLTIYMQFTVGLMASLSKSDNVMVNTTLTGIGLLGKTGDIPQTFEARAPNEGSCFKSCTCTDKNSAGNYTLMQCYRTQYSSFPEKLSELWHSLEILSMPYNNLTYLDPNLMPDLPNLTALHLQNNNIVSIAQGTFDKYTKLKRLELSSNFFATNHNYTSLRNVLCGLSETSITHLYLHRITHDQPITVSSSTFQCLENTSLIYLDFSYNHMLTFPDGLFSHIRQLQYLDLRKSVQEMGVNVKAFLNLHSLKYLLLQLNPMQEFPNFLDIYNSTILPNLTTLCLDFGIFSRIIPDRFAGLESVQILTLDWNSYGLKDLFKDNFIYMPNLKSLSLAHNTFENIPEGALNHPKLELLDLTGSTFTVNPIPDNLLQNLPSLKTLKFSEIYSLYAGPKSLGNLLRNLNNLEHLELRNLNLQAVRFHLFQNNKALKTIDLSNNKMNVIYPDLFELEKLTELYLMNNKILSITQHTFPPNLLRSLLILDISYNPFDCSCIPMYWFREQWMNEPWNNHTMKKKLHMDKEANNYACSTPTEFQDKYLDSVSLKDCLNAPLSWGFVLVFVLSVFISLMFLTISLVYKYQWHFKYWCFNLKAKWIEQHPNQVSDDAAYTYDAFVSYCSSDIKWVKMYILQFEKKNGLSFCLHERDWLAGTDIVDNIMNSIKQSRKIILVISNAFARSQWCYFEMTMIQVELLKQDKDNVILIVKEEVDDVNMNPRLAWHLKTKTYIEWPYAKGNYQLGESLLTSYRLDASLNDRVKQEIDSNNGEETTLLVQSGLVSGKDKAEKLFWEKLENAVLKPSTSILTAAL